jgi:hypothetical protein
MVYGMIGETPSASDSDAKKKLSVPYNRDES